MSNRHLRRSVSSPAEPVDGSGPDLTAVEAEVRADLDEKNAARELALKNCRIIIRTSANAIRALHRGERNRADELLAEARTLIAEAEAPLADHQDIYHAGFFYDAVKEYAEGVLTAALLAGERLPLMEDVYQSVSGSNYRNRAVANLLIRDSFPQTEKRYLLKML